MAWSWPVEPGNGPGKVGFVAVGRMPIKQQHGQQRVVVTGGAALLVSTLMDRHHDVDRDLLMRGIGVVAGL